jgi:Fe-S cluster assembly protein SufD
MLELSAEHQWFLDEWDKVQDLLPGNDLPWLSDARKAALSQFKAQAFPTRRDEDWKYMPVTGILQGHFSASVDSHYTPDSVTLRRLVGDDALCLVFVDGIFAPDFSDVRACPAGIECLPLSQAVKRIPDVLQNHFNQVVAPRHAFTELNTAASREGYVVYLKEGCQLDKPLQVIFFNDCAHASFQLRNMIIADKGASATIVEQYRGAHPRKPNNYFTNAVTEVSVADDAAVTHYKMIAESPRAFHMATVAAKLARASQFTSHLFTCDGAWVRSDTDVDFTAPNAEAHLFGLYLGRDEQTIDHHTRVHHAVPHCTSHEEYRGILTDAAQATFNGQVLVAKQAMKTCADQLNKNLLLSRKAVVNTKPQLEIFADDVKCTHGATVGQLDPDALFYLQSRGIDKPQAQAMLLEGFAQAVLDRVNIDPLKDALLTYL